MRFVPEPHAFEIGRPFRIAQIFDGADEAGPVRAGARRHRELAERGERIGLSAIWSSTRCAVAGPMPGNRCRMRKPATRSRGFSTKRSSASTSLTCAASRNFEPAELDEGNVAAGQLDLQRARMRGRPEQHRLVLQQRALLAVGQHLLDDVAGLVGLVVHGDELRFLRGGAVGPEVLGEALARQADDAIGRRQHGLRRAVVAVERDHLGAGREALRKIQDVADSGGAERIDRLRVVADDGQAASVRLQRQQDRGLQAVGVLIFVDQHMIEAAADFVRDRRIAHHLRPVEQEVVVIEHVLGLLGLDIGREQALQLGRPACAPGIVLRRAPSRSPSRH